MRGGEGKVALSRRRHHYLPGPHRTVPPSRTIRLTFSVRLLPLSTSGARMPSRPRTPRWAAEIEAVQARGLPGSRLRRHLLQLMLVIRADHGVRHPSEMHGDPWNGFSAEVLVRTYARYLRIVDRACAKHGVWLRHRSARAEADALRSAARERYRSMMAGRRSRSNGARGSWSCMARVSPVQTRSPHVLA
jgi:hypothetical protein